MQSKQPFNSRTARKILRENLRRHRCPKLIGCFHQGQSTACAPDHFLSIEECKKLEAAGSGRFCNRGKNFLRFDMCRPLDDAAYKPSNAGGDSLDINEEVMNRYVSEEPYALLAVESWNPAL